MSRYDGKSFTTYTTQDGLAGNRVSAILEDRKGQLWFGTDGGLSRYDGKAFAADTNLAGLGDNPVWSILQDREGHLWFGGVGRVTRYDGKHFTTFTTKDGLGGDNWVASILQDRDGQLWFGVGLGVTRYDGQSFTTFTPEDGLAGRGVWSVFQDREGQSWFGTYGGVSRYDGNSLTTFTVHDGLADNGVLSMLLDRKGRWWFGTQNGLSRYDGKTFTNFTTKNGLADNHVWSLFQDREGQIWFGTDGGVSRYDGKTFTTFTMQDGWAGNFVSSVYQDREGQWWFGTDRGVCRYDGKRFTTLTTENGLVDNGVYAVFQDREDHLWFGTRKGVSRYDGQTFTTFTTQDGLADNIVLSIFQDREGQWWFGTDGGVSRYDGKSFTTFTAQDGLAGNGVFSICQDREGQWWFGTQGGVSRYDGQTFQTLVRRDGLASNDVRSIIQDQEGYLWFGTMGGVTRFRPPPSVSPPVFIDAVVADQRYEKPSVLSLPSSAGLVVFEFHSISFKTRPEAMVYRYRLQGYDAEWHSTHAQRVEYKDLPLGEYTFEVEAVDRDLVYSESPATMRLMIHPPYGMLALASCLGLALVVAVVTSGYAIRRRKDLRQAEQALMHEMEKELQTAHTLQMDLMPRGSPSIPGFDLAGRCIPANHVGGDLFQYFHQDGKLSIALADVTGHAMEAAIPMVMFNGILKSQIEISGPIEELFGRLNRSLHNAAGSRTFVCFAFGTIDTRTSTLRLSSAAFPYPYHFSATTREIAELQVDAYPLGVRPDTIYSAIERHLTPGDYLVFCSDGIIEATDGTGVQFGYERTAATLCSGCVAGLSAEALLERIVAEVRAFRGEVPQGDDQTVVVLRVEI